MHSSTLIFLLTVFFVALSFSVNVANAGEEKKEEKAEGGEGEKKEGGGEEGGEGEEKKEEKKGEESGAMSFISSNGLSTALSLVIASVFFSFP
ncbi:hypothetical protein HNY73_014089 [Argiope bruennichi]|uniref:Uncharacterized protein n=1 Tax=Argiope bruennichi TaxID=94029 RepID=A0A8T0ES53_ARGBR|nr:hypothetical protein HNY73_014089 [Argiope bruennichi]